MDITQPFSLEVMYVPPFFKCSSVIGRTSAIWKLASPSDKGRQIGARRKEAEALSIPCACLSTGSKYFLKGISSTHKRHTQGIP